MASCWASCSNLYILSTLLTMASLATGYGKNFEVYWNIPTFMCRRYNLPFVNATEYYGIIQNENDDFQGDKIAIMYDPGKFPAILQNSSSKIYYYRNGGVPQNGDLREHLLEFEKHVNELIPDPYFNGLAIIDFESWRPIYRQNFGTLRPYQDLSESIVRKRHPFWTTKQVQQEASFRFEAAGKVFINDTLWLAQYLRPNAKWGYYGFPYCFNGRGNNVDACPVNVRDENNKLQWLFDEVDAIYPSVYLGEQIEPKNRLGMVKGRVEEAIRLASKVPEYVRPKVLVYHRYMFTDTLRPISDAETYGILNQIKRSNADGIVLWGSSNDLNTKDKCFKFYDYLLDSLGPVISALRFTYSVQAMADWL